MTRSRALIAVAAGCTVSVLLVLGVGAVTDRGERASDANPAAGPSLASIAMTVTTVRPERVNWTQTIATSGSIAAWQEAVVSAELGGTRLAEVLVDVGDEVQRGEVLARFDAATVRADLAQHRARANEASANLAEARANASRAIQLRDSSNISAQDLTSALTRAQSAQALLRSAEARVEMQNLTVQRTRVHAPDSGVISSRTAMLGAVPGIGAELFRLVRQNRLEWLAELSSAEISQVAPGMKASVTLTDGTTVTGSVRQLAPTLDTGTRTGVAYVALAKAAEIRPGMYAAGTITLGEAAGLAVPSSAIVLRDGREYVFVLTTDQHVELVAVQTGRRRNEFVEIVSGITAAHDLVARGGTFLHDGDRVRVTSIDSSS